MSDDTDNLRDIANYLYIKGGTSDKVREIRGAADLIDQLRADLLASQERLAQIERRSEGYIRDLLASQEREAVADLRYKDLSVEAADEFNNHHEAMLLEIDQWRLKHQVACDTITRMQSDREAVRARFIASQLEVERLREALTEIIGEAETACWSNVIDIATRALSTPPSPDALAAHDREVEVKVFRDTCDICAGIAQTLLRAGDPGEIEETIRSMATKWEPKP